MKPFSVVGRRLWQARTVIYLRLELSMIHLDTTRAATALLAVAAPPSAAAAADSLLRARETQWPSLGRASAICQCATSAA
jgi:hypothetical protein